MVRSILFTFPLLALALLAAGSPLEQREAAPGLIDDLLGGILGAIGSLIKDVLSGRRSGIDNVISSKPLSCSLLLLRDQCCDWWDVSAELTKMFKSSDGTCNDAARAAVRLGFHDAGSWDKTYSYGGADGSILMNFGEEKRSENNGLQSIITSLRSVKSKYGVGYADLVQYAHNHATISCPKGPRVKTFIGRKDATRAAPTGLIPDTKDSADKILANFANKGFTPADVVALVGAHATARQRFVDTSANAVNKPLDTTIGVWDVNFYNDTLNNAQGSSASQKIFVLPSDKALSSAPSLNAGWKKFVGNQAGWNEAYATAYIRMSLLGVTNPDSLIDCTKTLPASRTSFP